MTQFKRELLLRMRYLVWWRCPAIRQARATSRQGRRRQKPWTRKIESTTRLAAQKGSADEGASAQHNEIFEDDIPDWMCVIASDQARTQEFLDKSVAEPLTHGNVKKLEELLSKGKENIDINREGAHESASQPPLAQAKKLADLKEYLNKDCPGRSALGEAFRMEHRAGTIAGDLYKKCVGREEAKAFREEWAARKVKMIEEKYVVKRSWQRTDKTKGAYKNVSQLIRDEGGLDDPEAVRGSLNLIAKAILMGGDWIMRHPQTERLLFLHLEFSWASEFSKARIEYHTYSKKLDEATTPNIAGKADATQTKHDDNEITRKGEGTVDAKAKAKKR